MVSEASKLEKEWVSSTMGIIFAFNIIMWIFQCTLSFLNLNAKAHVVLLIIVYTFSDSVFEFINHLLEGYYLLDSIPEKERQIDSNFIHYTRLTIVSLTFILLIMIVVSGCALCFLA